MRVHDLLVYQGAGTLERLPAWWEDIDDDPRWQDSVFIALAVAYGTLAVVALVQVELFLLPGQYRNCQLSCLHNPL